MNASSVASGTPCIITQPYNNNNRPLCPWPDIKETSCPMGFLLSQFLLQECLISYLGLAEMDF